MRQDSMSDECRDGMSGLSETIVVPRALTYDERKAAEAAFRGEPFNPAWSVAAAKVYSGIQSVRDRQPSVEQTDHDIAEECLIGR